MNRSVIGLPHYIVKNWQCDNKLKRWGGGQPAYTDENSYVHISIDDVSICLQNLLKSDYSSIWKEPLFDFLLLLHNNFGVKISLFIFEDDKWESINNCYKKELAGTSSWLKFGLHSRNSKYSYGSATYIEAKNDWNYFVEKIASVTSDVRSVDRFTRLHNYAGTVAALEGMRDATYGAVGFLAADDERKSYYLRNSVENGQCIFDLDTELYFIGTAMRGDWFTPRFSSEYRYPVPKKETIYKELSYREYKCKEFFCHEWQLYRKNTLTYKKMWLLDVCEYSLKNGIRFNYPEIYINNFRA